MQLVLNGYFGQHKLLDVGRGTFVPLQKPGKLKGPLKKKILSNILIQGMKE